MLGKCVVALSLAGAVLITATGLSPLKGREASQAASAGVTTENPTHSLGIGEASFENSRSAGSQDASINLPGNEQDLVGLWSGELSGQSDGRKTLAVQIELSPMGNYYNSNCLPDGMWTQYRVQRVAAAEAALTLDLESRDETARFEGKRMDSDNIRGILKGANGDVELNLVRISRVATAPYLGGGDEHCSDADDEPGNWAK